CAVPCSGDGATKSTHFLRDNWVANPNSWAISKSLHMHALQLSIAKRSMSLLCPVGTMVYSTRSLSPYKNEAVVAQLL
ncbi:hypothetical protein B484DRAFT_318309, partial [Ochromonadaceae sp. CCMP2298]